MDKFLFSDLFDTIVTNGGMLPDIIKLERIMPSPKKSVVEPNDVETLALITDNKELFWKRFSAGLDYKNMSRYVRIPTKEGEQTEPFPEMVFVERFKIKVAYIEPMPKWTNLGECFTSILWDAWLEASDREPENNVDFLRIVSTEKEDTVLDFIRTDEVAQFVNFSREKGKKVGPPLRPINMELWQAIDNLDKVVGKCNIYTATFKELPTNFEIKNDFIMFNPKDFKKN